MNPKCLFLFALLFKTATANCQEKFIEVTVSDTMMVTPNRFIYSIVAKPAEDNYDFEAKANNAAHEKLKAKETAKQKLRLDSLKNILAQKGFGLIAGNNEDNYNKAEETELYYVRVNVSSQDSLAMLFGLIKNNPGFYGYIASRKAVDEDAYRRELWQRIIQAARMKAAALAGISSLQLDGIISLKEDTKEEAGWTAYPPLSVLRDNWETSVIPGWHSAILPSTLSAQYKIEASLTVRFAAK